MKARNKSIAAGFSNAPFYVALGKAFGERGMTLNDVCSLNDSAERRILEEYGAIFVADKSVVVPPVCIFSSEAEVAEFQKKAGINAFAFAETMIELQPAALKKLLAAREQANDAGLQISPRGGSEAARRSYAGTVRLWETRFLPAIEYWTEEGRLSAEQAARLRLLPLRLQIAAALELEQQGIFFSKDFSKTILQSVAAPGASQHLSMLAFDVAEFADADVRSILARHGWHQTVLSDLPHFTFLGVAENELPARGLRRIEANGQNFWVPDVG
jgi:hypothetical protein